MGSGVFASELVAWLIEDNPSFKDYIRDSIKIFFQAEKPFLIFSREGFRPIIVQIDEEGISVAFLSELQTN